MVRGAHCVYPVYTTWFMLNAWVPSGSLESWYDRCLCDQPPIKTVDAEFLMIDSISYMLL